MTGTSWATVSRRLRERHRIVQLSSDRRAGTHSKREIRALQRQWIRLNWASVLGVTIMIGALVVAASFLTPDWSTEYVIGAFVASLGWQLHLTMLDTGGIATKRLGVLAEQWTADELRKLRRRGWLTINHVMLKDHQGDVDHAVVGPGGFFALNTKQRSDWSDAVGDIGSMASSAVWAAERVRLRIGPRASGVTPMVVAWGVGARKLFPRPVSHDGAVFCSGHHLREYLTTQLDVASPEDVQAAFGQLSDYVSHRERREAETFGEVPRNFGAELNDALLIFGLLMASLLTIIAPVSIRPVGLWSIVTAAVFGVIAWLARRRWPGHVRTQRVTTAILTTAAGCTALLAAGMVITAIV